MGREGKYHLHIQFGTGTFDPLLEFPYAINIAGRWSLALFSMNKISVYENSKTYKRPFETINGMSVGYAIFDWFTSRITLANFSQSWAKWDGKKTPIRDLSHTISRSILPSNSKIL